MSTCPLASKAASVQRGNTGNPASVFLDILSQNALRCPKVVPRFMMLHGVVSPTSRQKRVQKTAAEKGRASEQPETNKFSIPSVNPLLGLVHFADIEVAPQLGAQILHELDCLQRKLRSGGSTVRRLRLHGPVGDRGRSRNGVGALRSRPPYRAPPPLRPELRSSASLDSPSSRE